MGLSNQTKKLQPRKDAAQKSNFSSSSHRNAIKAFHKFLPWFQLCSIYKCYIYRNKKSQNVPELPHIVESRPPREVHPSQVPMNQRIPRPPTGRYSDYFYLNDEDRTYGQTDLLHENWDYHVAVPRRDRRGPFVRLFGRYVLSVPVPRELRWVRIL